MIYCIANVLITRAAPVWTPWLCSLGQLHANWRSSSPSVCHANDTMLHKILHNMHGGYFMCLEQRRACIMIYDIIINHFIMISKNKKYFKVNFPPIQLICGGLMRHISIYIMYTIAMSSHCCTMNTRRARSFYIEVSVHSQLQS